MNTVHRDGLTVNFKECPPRWRLDLIGSLGLVVGGSLLVGAGGGLRLVPGPSFVPNSLLTHSGTTAISSVPELVWLGFLFVGLTGY